MPYSPLPILGFPFLVFVFLGVLIDGVIGVGWVYSLEGWNIPWRISWSFGKGIYTKAAFDSIGVMRSVNAVKLRFLVCDMAVSDKLHVVTNVFLN